MPRAIPLLFATLLLAIPILPAGGAEEEPVVIELKGKAPDWWNVDVRDAADRAALQGKLLNPLTGETFTPQEAAVILQIPVGAPDYLFVRPGALALSHDDGALCTYNFIYSLKTQIGLAGHCVARNGEPMYILAAPGPTIPLITRLGTVASHRNGGYVKHVGHGIQTGVVAAVPRVGTATVSNGASFQGVTEVSGGDSGSALIQVHFGGTCSMGAAAGVLTHCASIGGLVCIPMYWATDIRKVPATVTTGFDPI